MKHTKYMNHESPIIYANAFVSHKLMRKLMSGSPQETAKTITITKPKGG